MAYVKEISDKCYSCGKRATHAVFNRNNSSHGMYCKRCANLYVVRLTQLEQESDKQYEQTQKEKT